MNAKNVLGFASDKEAKFVSVRFTDLPGSWHHLTYPISQLTEDSFEEGFGFDASSLRGWAAINESDMLLIPDPSRFWLDPFASEPTICLIANVVDPITKEGYGLDPRSVAVRAESYLKFTGVADTVYFGPEAEFFVFDQVSYHNNQQSAGFSVDSEEGHWNSGRSGDGAANTGFHIRAKEGYVPVAPLDTLIGIRNAISLTLAPCFSSVTAVSMCALRTANRNGVKPAPDFASSRAPASSRTLTAAVFPSAAAHISAV